MSQQPNKHQKLASQRMQRRTPFTVLKHFVMQKTQQPQPKGPTLSSHQQKGHTPRQSNQCKYCGGAYAWKKEACPAFGKTCKKCKEKNHFARFCKQSDKSRAHGVDDHYIDPEFLISQVCTTSSIGSKRLCAELIVHD